MRVAVVAHSDNAGGAEMFLSKLYRRERWAIRNRDNVRLFGKVAQWEESGWDAIDLQLSPKWNRNSIINGMSKVRKEIDLVVNEVVSYQPDVIHMQFKREQIAFTKQLSKIAPVVWTEHGQIQVGHVDKVLGVPYALSSRNTARVIAVSRDVANSIKPFVPRNSLGTVVNGIEGSFSQVGRAEQERALCRFGLDPELPTAAFITRLHPNKGVLTAVKSCVAAGMQMIVAGDGPMRRHIEEASRINRAIKYLGHVRDTTPVYQACDFNLIASQQREGIPTTILESALLGRATLVTSEARIPQTIDQFGGIEVGSSFLARAMAGFTRDQWRDLGKKAGMRLKDGSGTHMQEEYRRIYMAEITKHSASSGE